MANEILTTAQYNKQIGNLEKEADKAQKALSNISGFYSRTNTPTQGDLVKEVQLKSVQSQLEKLRSQKLAQQWYGSSASGAEMVTKEPKQGWLMSGLSSISQPLYASVGAAEYLTGQGERGEGFFESMDTARKAQDTYGTLLKKAGLPVPIAAPLGLAADIILDPVNMVTLGSAGFVGKIGLGAIKGAKTGLKGAARGAAVGAKASTLKGASTVARATGSTMNVLPKLIVGGPKRKAAEVAIAALEKGGMAMDSPEMVRAITKAVNPEGTWAGRVQNALYNATKKIDIAKGATKGSASRALLEWEKITGETVERMLERRAARLTLSDYTRGILEKIPGGEKFLSKVDMNLTRWQANAMSQDLLLNTFRENKALFEPAWNSEKKIYDWSKIQADPQITEKINGAMARAMEEVPDEVKLILENNIPGMKELVEKELADTALIVNQGKGITRGANTVENTNRMLGEVSTEELWSNVSVAMAKFRKTNLGTGIEKVDKAFDKVNSFTVKNVAVGKKVIDSYGKFIGLFKSAKLGPLSPASMVYATVGNAAMAHMFGLDMTNPKLYKNVKNALSYLRGKTEGEMGEILRKNPDIKYFAQTFKTLFAKQFGFTYDAAMARGVVKDSIQRAIFTGDYVPGTAQAKAVEQEIIANTNRLFKRSKEQRMAFRQTTPSEVQAGGEMTEAELKFKFGLSDEVEEDMLERVAQEKSIQREMGTMESVAPLAQELAIKPFLEMKDDLARIGAAGNGPKNVAARATLWAINQSRKYELVDQSWRLGTFVHLVQDGVTRSELRHMTGALGKGSQINPIDILSEYVKNDVKYYRIQPARAALMANEIYMNYAAMPAAVKALRQIPIFGYPFFSFAYAMALKTGETALVNPAAFNKVNFFLKELERDKSPMEKQALKGKYYSWYNSPGMVGLPNWLGATRFFSDNPVYMNVASMIPYYSMNMFMPSERKFEKGWRGQLAGAIDNVPVLKDPIGQLITDYFILPSIIRDVQPQNMWGGPLYPADAPIYQKYLTYPLRQLGEAVLPSSIAAPATLLPEPAIKYLPSYPGRKTAMAVRGKTPVGVKGTEPTSSRTVRAIGSLLGVNLYPVNLSFLTSQVKKSMKK